MKTCKPMDTPLKSIRKKCLDCMCGNANEVKLCPSEDCPTHRFRFGKNPNRSGIGRKNINAPQIPNSTSEIDQ